MRSPKMMLATLAAASALTLPLLSPTASASEADDCPKGSFCIWGNGAVGKFRYQVPNLGAFGNGKLNDHIERVHNNTAQKWCIWEHANYSGGAWSFKAGAQGRGGGAQYVGSSARPC